MSKRRYRTVAPIANLEIEFKTPFQFAPSITIEAVPAELRKDSHLNDLAKYHREWLDGCKNALIIHYEADALYSPDPNWRVTSRALSRRHTAMRRISQTSRSGYNIPHR
jgi:hypothetical protein